MSTCSHCNTTFECGMADAMDAPCWCAALPALPGEALPDPGNGRCLCPSCLKAWIARNETPGAGSQDR